MKSLFCDSAVSYYITANNEFQEFKPDDTFARRKKKKRRPWRTGILAACNPTFLGFC